jgi:putative cardiolipin synthase
MEINESVKTLGPSSSKSPKSWAALISNGEMADANFELIEKAQKEIFLVEFLMRDDEFGLMKLALLRRKCREGVRIHVHVDAFHLLVNPALVKHLLDEGVHFTVFNELSFSRLNKVTARNHCKILIIDGTWLKMGDANTGNEYVHWGEGHQMKSIDVIIRGPEAARMRGFTEELMNCDLSKTPEIEIASAKAVNAQRAHIENLKNLAKTFFELLQIQMDAPDQFTRPQKVLITEEELLHAKKLLNEAELRFFERAQRMQPVPSSSLLWKKRVLQESTVHFHADPIDKSLDHRGVGPAIRAFLRSATGEITIVTPYLLLTDEMQHNIENALANSVKIRIYTNSLSSTDNRTTQMAYEYRLQQIAALDLSGALEVYEYQGAETIHAKFILRDKKDCMVMTYNLDWRSEVLNLETAVEFASPCLTQDLQDWLNEHQERFHLVATEGRVLKVPEGDVAASNIFKRLVIQAIEKQL